MMLAQGWISTVACLKEVEKFEQFMLMHHVNTSFKYGMFEHDLIMCKI